MRITEVFGPGECWHSARDRLLVIRARCPEFDAHSTLSLCQTKRTSSPFFSTSPQPSPPTRCLLPPSPLPCSTSTTTIRSRSSLLAHHVLAASTHRAWPSSAQQRDVARTRGRTFRAQPFLFLFSSFGGGLFSPEGRRKKSWGGEGRSRSLPNQT